MTDAKNFLWNLMLDSTGQGVIRCTSVYFPLFDDPIDGTSVIRRLYSSDEIDRLNKLVDENPHGRFSDDIREADHQSQEYCKKIKSML